MERLELKHVVAQSQKNDAYRVYELIKEDPIEYKIIFHVKECDFFKYEFIRPYELDNTEPVVKKIIELSEIIKYLKDCFERFKINDYPKLYNFDQNMLDDINSLYYKLKQRDLKIQDRLIDFNNKNKIMKELKTIEEKTILVKNIHSELQKKDEEVKKRIEDLKIIVNELNIN